MENRPLESAEEPDPNESITSRKKRGGDFLSQYLLRRRSRTESNSAEVDDDDEEETADKPKRLRRLFSRIFPSVVEPPSEGKSHQAEGFDFQTWLSRAEITDRPADASYEDGSSETTAQPLGMEQPPSEAQLEQPMDAAIPQEGGIPQYEAGISTEELSNPLDTIEATPYHAPIELPVPPAVSEANIQTAERAAGLPKQAAEKEVVIERGIGNALPVVLVGAEYLARKKADRKLESRVNEKIEQSQESVNRGALARQELEQLVKRNKEQLEILKQERAVKIDAKPSAVGSPEQPQNKLNIKPELKVGKPEQKAPTIEQIKTRPPEVRLDNAERAETVVPQKIFEQVASAAEHDVPVERVFERSHEVKDDKTTPVGAASVGSVMARQAVQPSSTTPHNSQMTSPVDTSGLPVIRDNQQSSESYKQAVKAGFSAAIVIIIFGVIAYLMIK